MTDRYSITVTNAANNGEDWSRSDLSLTTVKGIVDEQCRWLPEDHTVIITLKRDGVKAR